MISPYRETKNIEIYLSNVTSTARNVIVRARVQIKQFKKYLTDHYSTTPGELEANCSFIENTSSFEPTFEDLHAIIQSIARCEVVKYGQGVDDPRKKFSEFLAESAYENDFEKLREKYEISHNKRIKSQ